MFQEVNYIHKRNIIVVLSIMLFLIYPNSNIYAANQISSTIFYTIGDKGENVKSMKQDLVRTGFASWSNPTNYFGTSTRSAVKEFQSYYSLSVDGMMGPESLRKLNDVINSPYQKGKRSQDIQEVKFNLVSIGFARSEEHTSELQSRGHLV